MEPIGESSKNGVVVCTCHVKSQAFVFFTQFLAPMKQDIDNLKVDIEPVGTEDQKQRYKLSCFKITKEWFQTIRATLYDDTTNVQNPDHFKKLEGTMTVTDKDDGADVVWTVDYEKISSLSPDPHFIVDTCLNYFTKVDDIICRFLSPSFLENLPLPEEVQFERKKKFK